MSLGTHSRYRGERMDGRYSTNGQIGTRTERRAPGGVAWTDGYDQSWVDMVRCGLFCFGMALPSGGTASEFLPSPRQRIRDVRDAGGVCPASGSGLGF
jgi:hypothetical protein